MKRRHSSGSLLPQRSQSFDHGITATLLIVFGVFSLAIGGTKLNIWVNRYNIFYYLNRNHDGIGLHVRKKAKLHFCGNFTTRFNLKQWKIEMCIIFWVNLGRELWLPMRYCWASRFSFRRCFCLLGLIYDFSFWCLF